MEVALISTNPTISCILHIDRDNVLQPLCDKILSLYGMAIHSFATSLNKLEAQAATNLVIPRCIRLS